MITSIRRPISTSLLAIAAVIVLSVFTAAVAQADSGHINVKFDAAGSVTFVGPNSDPEAPTFSASKFKFHKDGTIKDVKITTHNELVTGTLTGLTKCKDNAGLAGCAALGGLLFEAASISVHTSTVKLKVESDDGVFLTGSLKGKLSGAFDLTSAAGTLNGSSKLKIRGTATYACIDTTTGTPTLLAVCHSGPPGAGMMFPLVLDVEDKGNFKMESGLGIESMKGKIAVIASFNLILGHPDFHLPEGDVIITKAKAKLNPAP